MSMDYFASQRNNLRLLPGLGEEGPALRSAQAGAAWAVASHFTVSEEPALIVMPTGTGKTAVMTLLPFLLGAKRVLVVTPSVLVRDQVFREFSTLSTLKITSAVSREVPSPVVRKVTGQMSTVEKWLEAESADVVVATPHCISPGYRGVLPPPDDFFDLLIIDEAHHIAAATWSTVLRNSLTAKKVLLTATPFRRDRKIIAAQQVYNYPLARALAEGIYAPIDFKAVQISDADAKDLTLAQAAKDLLDGEPTDLSRRRLFIRTDEIDKADSLQSVYQGLGVSLGVVHSKRTLKANQETIEQVKQGALDGLISVGVLGEGFDLPSLKIAVYHDQHRSLPATLQFIGRIARVASDGPPTQAVLLAVQSDVTDETKILYEDDANWPTLIPALSEASIEREHRKRSYIQEFEIPEEIDISPYVLNPKPDVRVYVADVANLELGYGIDPGPLYKVVYEGVDRDKSLAVLVTVRTLHPEWMMGSALDVPLYELHLVLIDRERGMVFISTSTDANYRNVLDGLDISDARPINPRAINNMLNRLAIRAYYSVGLRSARPPGMRQPSYKMLASRHAEGAVTSSDGRAFGLGHAIFSFEGAGETNTLGVSIRKSKLWSVRSGSLVDFRDWCDWLGGLLASLSTTSRVPGMPINVPDELQEYPDLPIIGFAWPEMAFIHAASIESAGTSHALVDLEAEVTRENSSECLITLRDQNDSEVSKIRLKAGGSPELAGADAQVHLDTDTEALSIVEFFDEFPPALYFTDGTCVWGQTVFRSGSAVERFDMTKTEAWDWSKTDIKREAKVEENGSPNVQQTTVENLLKQYPDGVVVKDDGSREIADFVVFRKLDEWRCQVSLFHCKASIQAYPGKRIDDLYEVCGQAIKSMKWHQLPRFLRELTDRIESRNSTYIMSAIDKSELVAQLKAWDETNIQVSFEVNIVQPGLLRSGIQEDSDINTLLSMCEEWLGEQEIEFRAILAD
jgi:superfamily II DNA or RNA helicase